MLDVTTYDKTQALRTLLERLDEVQYSTHESHAKAIKQVRLAFEARITQAVAYKLTQTLDAITGD